MPLFSVVVLNWNGGPHLQQALRSVFLQTTQDFEVLLVDNASTDASVHAALQAFSGDPRFVFIQHPANLGYCRGHNIAFRACKGEFIVTMNPDVCLERDFLDAIHSAFREAPSVGMATGLLLRHSNPSMVDSAGTICFRHLFATTRRAGQSLNAMDPPGVVFGAVGACAVYRRTLLEDLGQPSPDGPQYFDEDFFTFFDEYDLQLRARWRGWTCRYVPSARATHVWRHSVKAGLITPAAVYHYSFRNYYLSLVKNMTGSQLIAALPSLILQEAGLIILSFLSWSPICLSAKIAAIPLIPTMLAKRRRILRSRKITTRQFNAGLESHWGYLTFLIRIVASEAGAGKLLSFSDQKTT